MTPEELRLLQLILSILSSISLLSNVALLVTVACSTKLRRPINVLQSGLALGELILAALWIVGNRPMQYASPYIIRIIGATFHFFLNYVSCYNFAISFYTWLTVSYAQNLADGYLFWLHLYAWASPALLTALAFTAEVVYLRGSVFGDATFEIWISAAYPELRLGLFYVILWAHFVGTVLMYILIFRVARRGVGTEGASKAVDTGVPLVDSMHELRMDPIEERRNDDDVELKRGNTLKSLRSVRGKSSLKDRNTLKSKSTGPMTLLRPGRKVHKKLIWRTALLAIGFLVSWMPSTIGRILLLTPGTTLPYWFNLLIAVTFALSGSWNSGVFFLSYFWSRGTRRQGVQISSVSME